MLTPSDLTFWRELGSGREHRNTPWAYGRRRYDIGGTVRTLDELHALITFFEARRGKLHGFRFRDFLDWKSCAPSAAPAATDQAIGEGDGETNAFALIKLYGDIARPIVKPITESVLIAIDGAATSAFSVDDATGLVTFEAPPADGAAITAGFRFDTPVRFDMDRLDIALDGFGAGRAPSIPLIEILL